MNKKLPMYKLIKEFILERINSGELKPDDRIPSEKELMETFHVSRITVRRALEELAIEGYVYKIQGIGAFVRKPVVSSPGDKLVGVLITPISDYLSMGILKGVESYLSRLGFHPVVQFCSDNIDDETGKLHLLVQMGVKGFIIMPHESSLVNEELRVLLNQKKPVVFVDRTVDGLKSYSVQSDNRKGAYDMVSHLVDVHECKKICFVSWEGLNISSVRDRYMGAMEAAKQYNVNLELMITNRKDLPTLTERLKNYDAVFACTDLIAAEILVNLEVGRCKVPEDIKVVAFDDRPFARYIHPPLTTVKQMPEQMGEKAAALLLSIMRGENVKIWDHYVPVSPVYRRSCGCTEMEE